ncbi:MAG: hypothetical protein II117_08545, partial [Clostridia bacterium]|nr:hypothetical protein [Clostridia bacterium]
TIKSRLNYARKSIKEGVKAFEKQGVKLYGASPIPFLTYFLAKSAAGVPAPIAAASITAAATATAATATAATAATATAATAATATAATAATASSGIAAFFASAAGKIAVAVAIAAALGGVGTGIVLATQKPAEPAIVIEETAIPSIAYTPTTIATPEATPVPTPVYAPVPTSELKAPEETLQALTGFSEEESVYILDSLRTILAGENEIDYINNSPVAEIWEIHSLHAYAPNGEKHEKPDRYIALELLPCYGVRLEDETILHVYLWEGVTEHDWIICRVLLVSTGSFLKEPKLSEWSLELPPEDALDVEERPQVHIRMKCEDNAFHIDPNTDDYDVHNYGVFSHGMTDHYTANIVEINRDWQLLGEYDSVDGFTDKTEGDWQVFYKYEWDEGTGKYTVWVKEHYYVMHFIFYTAWSDWEDGTEPRYSPFYYFPGVDGEVQYQPSFAVQTENRTWYRYLQ